MSGSEPGPPVKMEVKMSDIITCSSKELSLLEQMKMSDIFTSFSKELTLLDQVMMLDIFTCCSKDLELLLQQVMMSDIITFSSKESSLLEQVVMSDIIICSSKGLFTRASDDVGHLHFQLHWGPGSCYKSDIPGDISLLLACYWQNVRKEGNHEFSNTTI